MGDDQRRLRRGSPFDRQCGAAVAARFWVMQPLGFRPATWIVKGGGRLLYPSPREGQSSRRRHRGRQRSPGRRRVGRTRSNCGSSPGKSHRGIAWPGRCRVPRPSSRRSPPGRRENCWLDATPPRQTNRGPGQLWPVVRCHSGFSHDDTFSLSLQVSSPQPLGASIVREDIPASRSPSARASRIPY